MSKVRVPIDDLVNRSNQGDGRPAGIVCPKCGCLQFGDGRNVRNTRRFVGGVRRYRVCRACGKVFTTTER